MRTVKRFLFDPTGDRTTSRTAIPEANRVRLQAATAGVALAFAAGLAGAGSSFSAAPPATEAGQLAGADPAPAVSVEPALASALAAPATASEPAAGVRVEQLHPRKITAAQKTFTPSEEQMRNAKIIVDTGKELGLPPRAWVIAVATATQESTLKNLGHLGARNDHDSQGLFQQRPSSGWGTPAQITDPTYASTKFYKALQRIAGYENMPLTQAAQKVQVSAYPNHYAKWEVLAGHIIMGLENGTGPYADEAAKVK